MPSPKLRRSRVTTIARQRPEISLTDRTTARGIVEQFFPVWLANRVRMEEVDRWARCELDDDMLPVLPNEATDEFVRLRQTAPTPFGRLIVASLTQNAIVDDIRASSAEKSAPAYRLWTRNGMQAKQVPLIEAAATYGQSFALVLPAIGRLDGEKTAAFLTYSGMSALGFYTTPTDEYPEFFLEGSVVEVKGEKKWRLGFVDDRARYFFMCDTDGSNLRETDPPQMHGMGLCPVSRYYNSIDLEGRVTGEIAPVINVLARLDQDTQDRLVVQRFGAWAVRTIAGMKKPATREEQAAARVALGVGDFMVSEDPDTKFGSLSPTPMQGHLEARRDDVRDLAATSQTPSYHLLGLSDNVGAEGLAAAEATHMRKTDIRKLGWDLSHTRTLRLGGQAMGDEEIANDFEARCHWVQTRTEAFQSLAQALNSLVTSGIPIEMLVQRLPDWTQTDTEALKKALAEKEAKAMQDAEMAAQRQVEVGSALAKAKGATSGDAGGAAR